MPTSEAGSQVALLAGAEGSLPGALACASPGRYELSALVTLVAVRPMLRRSGLAQELCTQCDDAASGWYDGGLLGTPTMLMQVPQGSGSMPARWLGAKLGYREGFRATRDGRPPAPPDPLCGEAIAIDETLVTLGKRCGPVTWRLCAPVPP